MIIPPLVQSVTEKLPDGMQKFDHSQVHVLATMDMIPSMYPRCTPTHAHLTVHSWPRKLIPSPAHHPVFFTYKIQKQKGELGVGGRACLLCVHGGTKMSG